MNDRISILGNCVCCMYVYMYVRTYMHAIIVKITKVIIIA
jgi:hypothetical protein